MNNALLNVVNGDFDIYPESEKIVNLKKTIYEKMCAKYNECQDLGMTEPASFLVAVTAANPTSSAIYRQSKLV